MTSQRTFRVLLLIHKYLGLIPHTLKKQQNGKLLFTTNTYSFVINTTIITIAALANGAIILKHLKKEIKYVKQAYDLCHAFKAALATCTVYAIFQLRSQRILNVFNEFNDIEIQMRSFANTKSTVKRRNITMYVTVCRIIILLIVLMYDITAILFKNFWRLNLPFMIMAYFIDILTVCYSTLYLSIMSRYLRKFEDINKCMKSIYLENKTTKICIRTEDHVDLRMFICIESDHLKVLRKFFQRITDLKTETNNIFGILLLLKILNCFEHTVWGLYVILRFTLSSNLPLEGRLLGFTHTFAISTYYLLDSWFDVWINQKIIAEV